MAVQLGRHVAVCHIAVAAGLAADAAASRRQRRGLHRRAIGAAPTGGGRIVV